MTLHMRHGGSESIVVKAEVSIYSQKTHKQLKSSGNIYMVFFFSKSYLLSWGEVILCLVTLVLLQSVLRLSGRQLRSFMNIP